ncbi:gliding motility protein GldC [Crocinitomix catalasitica]|uniref:gliding motility protein GldC n=1 Tax=Crocinitomix catalasitica TaxID=184607 RepID=UPI0004860B31|nr:gliding motility protein GldC [Crocinitomix catalasitica]
MSKLKKSKIEIEVLTNENNLPEQIIWSAAEGGIDKESAEAMILSFWDKKANTAMRIDLWNKEFTVDDMKKFMHQTLITMADSFEKATGEKNMAEDLRDYCQHFAEKMGILPPLS